CVDNLPDANFLQIARDDPIHETRGVSSGDPVFVERGNVDHRGGITNRVVLVLVMRFVCADGVVAGPLAIIQTFAQRESPVMKGCPNRDKANIMAETGCRLLPKLGFAQKSERVAANSPPESGGADCEGVSARAGGVVPLQSSEEPPQRARQPAGFRASRP